MNLGRNLSVYAATSVFCSGLTFALLPVFTHFLTPSDFGLLAALSAYVALILPIISIGVPSLFSVEFYQSDRGRLRALSPTWIGLPLLLTVVFVGVALGFSDKLSKLLSLPPSWIVAIPVLAYLGFIPNWASVSLQLESRPASYAAYEIATALLQAATALLLVVALEMDWKGQAWALLFTGATATFVGFAILRPFIQIGNPKRGDIAETIRFGAGLIPHSVFSHAVRLADRLFVLHFVGVAAAGEFLIGWQVASMMLVLLAAFNHAWAPFVLKMLATQEAASKIRLVRYSYWIAFGFVGLFIAVNLVAPLVFEYLISEQFRSAQQFVPFVTLGYLFFGFYLLFTDYIFYSKKTHLFSLITTLNSLINLLLNYYFVQAFGAIGVSYAFAISNALSLIATAALSNRVCPMPWFHALRSR